MILRKLVFGLLTFTFAVLLSEKPLFAQLEKLRTPEQIKALYKERQGDFDYLLGDWEFTSNSKTYGKGRGYWSAVRIAEGPQVFDEFRAVSPDGDITYYASSTLRSYNAILDQWELVTAETGTGLQNIGTAKRVGAEMHIEQKFDVMSDKPAVWRIRYYNVKPDSFSWTADRSFDGGKTWDKEYQRIEARRIGPARSLGALAPARKLADTRTSMGKPENKE